MLATLGNIQETYTQSNQNMKQRPGLLENDSTVYRGNYAMNPARVLDYNDYDTFDGQNQNYRGVLRENIDGVSRNPAAEERIQKNVLGEQMSSSSFFGVISGSEGKQMKSYVKIVSFDDLKTETETYLRKSSIIE